MDLATVSLNFLGFGALVALGLGSLTGFGTDSLDATNFGVPTSLPVITTGIDSTGGKYG